MKLKETKNTLKTHFRVCLLCLSCSLEPAAAVPAESDAESFASLSPLLLSPLSSLWQGFSPLLLLACRQSYQCENLGRAV